MKNQFPHLLSPFNIGKTTFKNRMCVAPMGMSYCELVGPFGEYTPAGIEYIVERARGGFGLMFCGVSFCPDMTVDNDGYPELHFMNHQDKFMKAAHEINEQVEAFSMKCIQQLTMGFGRNYPGLYSCSATEVFEHPDEKSPVLSNDQVKSKLQSMVDSAVLMKESGFTGVEMHSLHWGYLMDQFAMAITNHREDEYGGSLENRLRICKELVEGIKQECGADFIVTMRLGLKSYIKALNKSSFTGEDEAGRTAEEGLRVAKLLEDYGYDALNVDVGMYDSFYHAIPPMYMPHGHVIPLAAKVREIVKIPVLCGSRMNDPFLSEEAIKDGKIDAVVLGRPSIADPYYARKIERGTPEKIRPCIGCNVGCNWAVEHGRHTSCAVNPQLRKEQYYRPQVALVPKKVIVVGSGLAGMEVACTAKKRGHDVTIYEKGNELGGMLTIVAQKTGRHKILGWPMLVIIIIGDILCVSFPSTFMITLGNLLIGFGVGGYMTFYFLVPAVLTEGKRPGVISGSVALTICFSMAVTYFYPQMLEFLMNKGLSMGSSMLLFIIPAVIFTIPTFFYRETGPKGKWAQRGEKAYPMDLD